MTGKEALFIDMIANLTQRILELEERLEMNTDDIVKLDERTQILTKGSGQQWRLK